MFLLLYHKTTRGAAVLEGSERLITRGSTLLEGPERLLPTGTEVREGTEQATGTKILQEQLW